MTLLQNPLDSILAGLCESLQLSPSRYDDAKNKYEAVGAWLRSCDVLGKFEPRIYPQGSVAIGTTVKPRAQDEYDVDLVLELNTTEPDSHQLYEAVARRLENHGNYAPILERMNRCLRLDYAGDFHLDILPAKPDPNLNNGAILVPERELSGWSPSNPEGFKTWFLSAAQHRYLEARKEVEPLPDPEEADEKPPLKRAVQLLKRCRDVVFDGGDGDAPRSIVLTTLAAQAYRGELGVAETLEAVINYMIRLTNETDGVLRVPNPMNPDENFAEKWNAKSYGLFVDFVHSFRRELDEVEAIHLDPGQGLEDIKEKLGELFGEAYSEEALKRHGARRGRAKKTGTLGVVGAGLGASSKGNRIPDHDFYGSG